MPAEPRRALVLAGGGIRVAWQAGVVQALDEAGLTFSHGDGTSGGIFTLGMLMSGVRPSELGQRWRTLRVQRFISFLPLRSYAKLPTNWSAKPSFCASWYMIIWSVRDSNSGSITFSRHCSERLEAVTLPGPSSWVAAGSR